MAQEKIVIFHHDERGAVRTWSEVGELVRCKDCIHYESDVCNITDMVGDDDDYCSYGERKEGE